MRFLRETFLVTVTLSAYGVMQAAVGAKELENVRPTTLQPNLPLSGVLGLAGFALTLVLYGLLGRAIVRAGAPPSTAAARGALAGLGAGLASALAQALLQEEFFRAVALAYGLPTSFGKLLLLGVVVASPLLGAAIGAVLAWLAALLSRPRREEPS